MVKRLVAVSVLVTGAIGGCGDAFESPPEQVEDGNTATPQEANAAGTGSSEGATMQSTSAQSAALPAPEAMAQGAGGPEAEPASRAMEPDQADGQRDGDGPGPTPAESTAGPAEGAAAEEPDAPTEDPDATPETGIPEPVEEEPPVDLEPFSFFVTSLEIMRELSGSPDGFGGDLGGLEGADGICQQAAEKVGFGAKQWRAFLSVTDGGDGEPVHAIDRIGEGPWYDRNGRLIAEDIEGLLQERPAGDPQTINDLPNEFGEGLKAMGDSHDVITGSNLEGRLASDDPATTCNDWTSTTVEPGGGFPGFPGGGRRPPRGEPTGPIGGGGEGGGVQLGHSWPARSGNSWVTVHRASSCAAGVNLEQNGPGDGMGIGAGGGWGGIYCFALTP